MKNHSMPAPMFFVFCLFFLLYHLKIATSTPRYIAVDHITLNCGSSAVNLKDMDERHWVGDMLSSKFALLPNHNSTISEAQNFSSVNAVPYQTALLSYSEFTCVFFPVTPGPKFVRLYFYSASYSGFDKSKDLFTVKAGLFTLLRNFSASILTDSLDKKNFFKEFCINVEENQTLKLTFIPFSSDYYAFINGIEIVSMPIDLYYSQKGFIKDERVPPYVAQAPQFYINYSIALEMVYRLNVGGSSIQPKEDTGMFREWLGDTTDYLLSDGAIPCDPSLKPKFSKIPNYTAPDAIYQSAISMGPNRTRNSLSNLTWGLPVDTGFNYLVRLHFCELEPAINATGTREFSIYIDSTLAEERADIILWTDSNDTPHYKDYVVMIQNKGEGSHVLSIDLHPVSDSVFLDAILNGVEVFKLSNPDGNLAARLNMVLPQPDQKTEPAAIKSKKKKTIFIAIGSGAGFLIVLILVCFMAVWKLRRTKHFSSCKGKIRLRRTKASSLPEELCHHFTLDEMKTATNNFHEELIIGVGGFGNVYKGAIDKGTKTVAIKRMNPESHQGVREFRTEIEMLSQLRHVHLVSLIGYCNDDNEMILVYDYMTNGTLRDHLYDTNNEPLTWKQRLKICIGAARGLHYLHTGAEHPIIHRDVKTTNILLDEKLVSKISDFGLSKMGLENTAVSTTVKGTWGYLDPDYAIRQQLTEKSDVYSFGVVMFEVLCARKVLNHNLEEEQQILASWARKCIERGTINQIIDPYLEGKISPECFKLYLEVAENCVCDKGIQRPTMNFVLEKLELALELQENVDAPKDNISRQSSTVSEESSTTSQHTYYSEVISLYVDTTTSAPGYYSA
ncbi:hypothetical protein SO802_012017 [Lithocarpus litseifolius]|uniref:Protein kinase domain-containing protein n=1 Tax=Lithocarpus litseifolius TaxID=425828 RepID=A0AAW2D5H5_9ROSI